MWNSILDFLKKPLYARRLSRVFDQPHDRYLLSELAGACGQQADEEGIDTLSEPAKALLLIRHASGVIGNGGFRYFFECGLEKQPIEWAYQTAGCPKKAGAVRAALQFFPDGKPSTNFDEKMKQLAEIERTSREKFEALSSLIWSKEYEADEHLAGYVRRNRSAFNGRYLSDDKPDGEYLDISPPAADSSTQDVAHWLLSIGAWLRVLRPGEEKNIFVSKLPELPSGTLRIVEVRLSSNRSTTDRDLGYMTRLSALAGLKSLDLSQTNVSREGLAKIQSWQHLAEIDLSGCVLRAEDLETLPEFPQVTKLKFPRNINESALKYLKRFPNLKEFEGIDLSDAGLPYLASHGQLEDLSFMDKKITDEGLAHIGRISSLKKLTLWRMPLTDAGIAHLKDLTQLEYLNISSLKIGDPSLSTLGKFLRLKFLSLECCEISDLGMLELAELVNLEDLRLYETKVADEGLRALSGMTRLKHLTLGHTQVTGTGLAYWERLVELRELYLYKTKLTDEGMKNLRHLKSLEVLWAGENEISDEGLAGLRDLTKLSSLNLDGANIRGPGLEHLTTLPVLESVTLSGNPIGNSALHSLNQIKALRSLDLSKTRIDNAAFEVLQSMRQLTYLRLGKTLIEEDVMNKLEAAMPDCKICTY